MKKHGMRYSREYGQWVGAKARCHQLGHKDWSRYGGRGIVMCERWRNDFAAFYADMGACPDSFQLDRIDTHGNYEPGNCRWASRAVQQQNRITCYRWFVRGHVFESITAVSEYFGVSLPTVVRWCEGYFDKRRGHFRPPRPDCWRERRYT